MEKCRICEILGLEENEHFQIKEDEGNWYCVDSANERIYQRNKKDHDMWTTTWNDPRLIFDIIADPSKIIHKQYWRPCDIDDAKAIRRLYPNATMIRRNPGTSEPATNEVVRIYSKDGWIADLNKDHFTSLKSDKDVLLDDIINFESRPPHSCDQ